MKINHIIYIAGLLALAGCSEMEEALTGRVPVTLSQSTVQATPTRAAQNLNEGYIDKGADIDVLIKGADEATYVFTADVSDDGKMSPKSTVPYYPATGTVDIYAWYPSEASADFEVSSDQTGDAAYQSSDLMVASATGKSKTSGTVALAFDHKMAKLNVNVTAGDGITGITGITLKDVQCKATFTKTGDGIGTVTTVTTDGEHAVSDITMTNNGAVVFPAQTLDGELLAIATPEGTATYAISSKDFEAGHQYTLNITLNNTAVGSTNYINGWSGSGSATVNPAAADQLAIGDISDQTYNGSAIEPTPTVSYNSSVLNSATDYELIYRDNTNAGTATVIAIGTGTYAGKAAAKNFTIQKADLSSLSVSMSDWSYNSSSSTPSVTGNSGSGTVTYQYKSSGAADNTYSEDKPSNAGTYTVKATVAETANYNGGTATADFTISKATQSVTLSATSLTIDVGSTGSFTVTRSGDGAITATSSNESIATASVDQSTGVVTVSKVATGDATITVEVAEGTNYNAYSGSALTVTVSSDPGIAFDNVTSSHKGYYIAKNGKAYSTMALANQYSTAVGYICYAGSVDKYFSKFIAIALNDAHTTYTTYSDAQSKVGTYASTNAVTVGSTTYNTNSGSSGSSCYDVVTNSTSTASNTRTGSAAKGWRIPTVTDWRYIFAGIGGPSATSPVGVGSGTAYGNGSTLRSSINTACGNTALQPYYWSSSELSGSTGNAWYYGFNYSYFYITSKSNINYVRAVFAY